MWGRKARVDMIDNKRDLLFVALTRLLISLECEDICWESTNFIFNL